MNNRQKTLQNVVNLNKYVAHVAYVSLYKPVLRMFC